MNNNRKHKKELGQEEMDSQRQQDRRSGHGCGATRINSVVGSPAWNLIVVHKKQKHEGNKLIIKRDNAKYFR